MPKVPIREIPYEKALTIEIAASDLDAERLLEGADDFSIADASRLEATARLQRVGEAVRVAGAIAAPVRVECGRCLEVREVEVDAEIEYVLMTRAGFEAAYGSAEEEGEVELSADDLDVQFYEGEQIDLAPLLRESLLLELPPFGTCPPELARACDLAYEENVARFASDSSASAEEAIDPRWAALAKLRDGGRDREPD